jgi:trehalose 6-phosphate phosphatase
VPSSDGVAGFLDPRHISLPRGAADDPPEKETVCSLGNRKNGYFLEIPENEGVTPFASTVDFIKRGKKTDLSLALISASRNARRVLAAASLTDLFDAILDGENAARLTWPANRLRTFSSRPPKDWESTSGTLWSSRMPWPG